MQIVPFNPDAALPAYLQNREDAAKINQDVFNAAKFPTMSIKGKVFTIVKDGVRKLLTKPDDPDEVAQSIGIVVLRSNMKARVYYSKKYAEGDSDGARPDCYTFDGVTPSPSSPAPQSKKCATCPHAVWGSKVTDATDESGERKGTACAMNARMAIAAPDKLDEAMLIRVPPASLKNWRDAVKILDQRKIPYNAAVMKLSFDPERPSPTLKFKPVGLLSDEGYAQAGEQYESEVVRAIVGLDDHGVEAVVDPVDKGGVSSDELDAALAARQVAQKASDASKPPAEPPAPAPAPAASKPRQSAKAKPPSTTELDEALGAQPQAAAPAPAPAAPPAAPAAGGADNLLNDLDALLGKDD